MQTNFLKVLSILFCLLVSSYTYSFANNLTIDNVVLGSRNPSNSTVIIQFDVSWENSWRTKINHDATWLTFRLYDPSVSPTNKKLCNLSASGLNPAGFTVGSDTSLEFYTPQDLKGAFLRKSSNSALSNIDSDAVQVTIDYSSCGFTNSGTIYASVLGLEMVYVPAGSFYAGDGSGSAASFVQGSSDTDSWVIASESAIAVTAAASDAFYYQSASNVGENASGDAFTISADFPKGYGAFYSMKYEISEEQWVEFFNSLPSSASRLNRDVTNASHKNGDAVTDRNTISCVGSPAACATERPARSASYLAWTDVAAFLDWAALRPMTELEFEKMARGGVMPIQGEFAWGSTNITAADAISAGEEDGDETITTTDANANYGNGTFSGGDSSLGVEYDNGALRGGIFAANASTREAAGASKHGAMELSGNLAEYVVTLGNATGRSFTGTHGDGYLTTAAGFEGNANVSDWPGMNVDTTKGVTGSAGSGLRGGSWADSSSKLRVSDRSEAALAVSVATSELGGRGIRTDDAQ